MKAILGLEGNNEGASFLKSYIGQKVNFESLYKNIDANAPPLAHLRTEDNKLFSIQLIDIRFIEQNIFINCFAINDADNIGGKALIRLTPIND